MGGTHRARSYPRGEEVKCLLTRTAIPIVIYSGEEVDSRTGMRRKSQVFS